MTGFDSLMLRQKRRRTMSSAAFFIAHLLSRQQYRQHSLLDMQTVLSFGEDLVGVGLEDGGRFPADLSAFASQEISATFKQHTRKAKPRLYETGTV